MSEPLFTLKRVSCVDDGCFGVLIHDYIPFAVTLERTYDGPSYLPKISTGRHVCTRTRFYKGGYETFEVHESGHSRLLFHRGNLETHSDGCVLVGESFGVLNGEPAILQSGEAFKEFMIKAIPDEFILEVISC